MADAPSVSYPVGRSRLQGWLTLGMPLMAWLAWATWAVSNAPTAWPLGAWALWAALIGATAWAFWRWRRTPEGTLSWSPALANIGRPEGQGHDKGWRWRSAAYQTGAPVHDLEVVLDFQHTLLIAWRNPDGARHWAWLEERPDAGEWWAFRRALHTSGAVRH